MNKKDKKVNNSLILIIIAVIILVILLINFILGGTSDKSYINEDITKVKKVLSAKYLEIDCVDKSCKYVVAVSGNLNKKASYSVFNSNGKKIAKYNVDYSKKGQKKITVVQATKNYIVTREKINDKTYNYVMRTTNGKELYSTNKKIIKINDNYALYENDTNNYVIIDKKGKTKYTSISDYKIYANGQYLMIKISDKYYVLNEDGKQVLSNYIIDKEVNDENGDLIYLIVKNQKNNLYYYYNLNKEKIVGNSFINYKESKIKNEMLITRVIKNENIKYRLNEKGIQKKLSDNDKENNSNLVKKIRSKIDDKKYNLYSYGIESSNQENVFVDNMEDKSFGVLNLKTNDYNKMYSYNAEKTYYYSSLSKLDSKNSSVVYINCSSYNCDEANSIIYNLDENKEIYSAKGNDLIISEYTEYEDGYKVINYSNSSSNEDLRGKSVLMDKNDKILLTESSSIVLVDKKLIIGKTPNTYLILYNTTTNKKINSEDSSASKIKFEDKTLYKYIKDDKTIICDSEGKEIINIDITSYITYSNNNIIYLDDNKLCIYNVNNNETKYYEMEKNEELINLESKLVAPYRGAVFINNPNEKTVKILNSKAKVIRNINNAQISSININKEDGHALIIVKKLDSKNHLYELYVAK